jgi:hypothetical protein
MTTAGLAQYRGWRRPPTAPQVESDSPFVRLLGPTAWVSLPIAVRHRFLRKIAAGASVTYAGEVVECRISWLGWLLAQAARLIGAPLPLSSDCGTPATVCVTEDRLGDGQFWSRHYGRLGGFPQVIQSTKRFTGPTGLEEYLGLGIGIALRLAVRGETLLFISDHYFVALPGGVRLRWPHWLEPGELTVGHVDLGGDRFAFTLDLVHGRAGELFHQVAIFADGDDR